MLFGENNERLHEEERERAMGRTVGYIPPAARTLARMPPGTEALVRETLRLLAEKSDALANPAGG